MKVYTCLKCLTSIHSSGLVKVNNCFHCGAKMECPDKIEPFEHAVGEDEKMRAESNKRLNGEYWDEQLKKL